MSNSRSSKDEDSIDEALERFQLSSSEEEEEEDEEDAARRMAANDDLHNGQWPRIRIRRIQDEATRQTIAELKLKGNEAFEAKQYEKAIEFYDEAAMLFPTPMLVAPTKEMNDFVILLSNIAGCYLQLQDYDEAGNKATDALVLDSDHEKSRIRRAKVDLVMGSWVSLIQARVDLEAVLNNPESTRAGRVVARKLLKQVESNYEVETRREKIEEP